MVATVVSQPGASQAGANAPLELREALAAAALLPLFLVAFLGRPGDRDTHHPIDRGLEVWTQF
jgi:hypothetical protein